MSNENKSHTPESIRDLWQTPKEIFNSLDKEFNFTGDVAASDTNALCARYLTENENALNCDWFDVNWCNPPYSETPSWANKAIIEHRKGKTIVMLIPADSSVKWFWDAWYTCNEVRLINGRISFVNAETQKPVSGNNKGSALFVWKAYCKSHCVSLIRRNDLL